MRVDKRLNLVFQIECTAGGTAYVHAMPISQEVFEQHFKILAQTYTNIWQSGLNITGPKIAFLMLKELAVKTGVWEGPSGVQDSLMAEIHRLCNVAMPSPSGFVHQPLYTAIQKGLLDESELAELDNALTFFTLVSVMQKRAQAAGILIEVAGLWAIQTTYLGFTEYLDSLQTLIAEEILTTQTSSVPT